MKIKDIKAKYQQIEEIKGLSGKKQFTVFTFEEPIGKCVVVVVNNFYMDRVVVALVQVSTGIDILADHSRPCDNMEDAIDVADEIVSSMANEGELDWLLGKENC